MQFQYIHDSKMPRSSSALSIRGMILKYNLKIPIAILYWIFFSFSDGTFEYYRQPIRKLFSAVVYTGSFHNFLLLTGIYWFPSSHFGFSFPLFQTVVSVILSAGILIIVNDLMHTRLGSSKQKAFVTGSTLSGAVITTGACCTVPFAVPLLSIFSQSFALGALVFLGAYSDIIDLFVFVIIILFHLKMS